MKSLLLIVAILASLNCFSSENFLAKYTNNTIKIDKFDIEGFLSKDGVYARPIDIFQGIEKLEGINVNSTDIIINPILLNSNPIEAIYLNNGKTFDLKEFLSALKSGGDMGGGFKPQK